MSAYYYTLAALPQLSFDNDRLPSMEEFLSFCKSTIPSADYARLTSISTDTPDLLNHPEPLIREYARFDVGLRNELVRHRATRHQKNYADHAHILDTLEDFTVQPGVADIAREAAGAPSPLEGEHLLMRARLRKIDELCVGHAFDFTILVAYQLKLSILLRKVAQTHDAGKESFDRNYQQLSTQIHEHVKDLGE